MKRDERERETEEEEEKGDIESTGLTTTMGEYEAPAPRRLFLSRLHFQIAFAKIYVL